MRDPIERTGEPAVRYAVDDDEPLEDALCRAAERAGVDVAETDRVLYDVIDASALDRLFRSRTDVTVSLSLWGLCAVVAAGEIEIHR